MYLFLYLSLPEFSDTDAGGHMSFDPVHFIRSHSKNNDPADIQTQVRNVFTKDYYFFFVMLIKLVKIEISERSSVRPQENFA